MTWVAHVALILVLTATGPDSLLILALCLLVARTAWVCVPKARPAEPDVSDTEITERLEVSACPRV